MEYLGLCKALYFKSITPLSEEKYSYSEYIRMVQIVKEYEEKNSLNNFAAYLKEDKYFVQLWTAHLILEFGTPTKAIREACFNQILKYSDNLLAPAVAKEERDWLVKNRDS